MRKTDVAFGCMSAFTLTFILVRVLLAQPLPNASLRIDARQADGKFVTEDGRLWEPRLQITGPHSGQIVAEEVMVK